MPKRRKIIRLQHWDYRNAGAYFVTICTKEKVCHFGDIQDDQMQLSEMGKIAEKFWKEIPVHFPDVELDEFVVMPNHVHGIVAIHENDECRDVLLKRPYDGENPHMSQISPKKNSLSVIIRFFKRTVTKTIHEKFPNKPFAWQPRFYDRIIRDDRELETVREYISNNPLKWALDAENPVASYYEYDR